ncbi:hypothetical protein MXD62_16815 [Frankia sp. Mgl5]|uniref:hypothetical protein n=1 Tax=Frankia sp. Mgl5 TaxID=2933793 RepID=UPI00200FB238|nr:hypothetical protein [Frankia sp. Mgl5]MCK9928819.1 hypothetical protein [Frankia sp. Mgl5]
MAAATAALHTALLEWADGDVERTRIVRVLAGECGGLWLREAAAGRLRRWFPTTDHEGMSDLQVAVDLEGLRRAFYRGQIGGGQWETAALLSIIS